MISGYLKDLINKKNEGYVLPSEKYHLFENEPFNKNSLYLGVVKILNNVFESEVINWLES